MKKSKGGHKTAEKAKAGAHKPSGVNMPMEKESVPQRVAKNTYGSIKPKQKT